MLVSKKAVIERKWREHEQQMDEFRESCFRLISHPELTAEQLATVVQKAAAAQRAHEETKAKLQKEGYRV